MTTKFFIKATLFFLAAAIITACSGSSSPEPSSEQDAKEIKAKTKNSLDLPELELFSNAKRQYAAGLYSVSRDSFEALKDNYPTGPFAEFAEIKVADTYFENNEFPEAAKSYEEFISNRPASSALPYAMLRAGRSNELSNSGVGRDPGPLEKALEQYKSLLERFPDSVYCSAARHYKKGVEQLLAAHEQSVISFYEDKNKEAASSKRNQDFRQRFGKDSNDFEAADYNKKEALDIGPIAQQDMERAKKTLENLPPIIKTASVNGALPSKVAKALPAGKSTISSVHCDPAEKLIMLAMEPRPSEQISNLTASIKGDFIELNLPAITTADGQAMTYSCFAEGDITISSGGLITIIAKAEKASALFVDNPARVVVSLE